MYLPALMASLHHFAAFTLVATLAVEVATFKPPLSVLQARRLQRTDLVFGTAAAVLLVVGLLRTQWFEKGPAYYWHDVYFLIKLGAFIVAGLISIYPSITYLSWNQALTAGRGPDVSKACTKRVRLCLMLELTTIFIILPCAALMARGFGYLR